jgi:hypothetical protein
MNQVVNIEGKAIDRIEYKGHPIITLPMIDELHERPSGTARKAFNRHKKRMVEGRHYFLVPQSEWKMILGVHEMDAQKKKGGHTGDMHFLTQIGYAKLIKVFDDDLSWDIYELMVDSYFGFLEKPGPDRRIGIEHTRSTNAPNGLDIRYNLDLTKIIANPTPKSIMLLSRLTGIDLEDIAEMPDENGLMFERFRLRDAVATFFLEECVPAAGAMTGATDLYNAFIRWNLARSPEEKIPSQKIFGTLARNLSIKKDQVGGIIQYFDIRLKDAEENSESG